MYLKFIKITSFFILIYFVSSVNAHEIHMKDGRIIKSDTVWEENNIVKYQKFGAIIGFNKSEVEDVIYKEEKPSPKSSPKMVAGWKDRYKDFPKLHLLFSNQMKEIIHLVSQGQIEEAKITYANALNKNEEFRNSLNERARKKYDLTIADWDRSYRRARSGKASKELQELERKTELSMQMERAKFTEFHPNRVEWNYPNSYQSQNVSNTKIQNPFEYQNQNSMGNQRNREANESQRVVKESLWYGQHPGRPYNENPYSKHHFSTSDADRFAKENLWNAQHVGRSINENPYSRHHNFNSEDERINKETLWDAQHSGRPYGENPYSKANELKFPYSEWDKSK